MISKKPSSHKLPLWLPYLQEIILSPNKRTLTFKYNGGETTSQVDGIHSILLYGDALPIQPEIVELLGRKGVPIIIHRRNLATNIWIHSGVRKDTNDILTRQILTRSNTHKRHHIARTLLSAKLKSMRWCIPTPDQPFRKGMTLAQMRTIEAYWSKRYWSEFYNRLQIDDTRRGKSDLSKSLDAVSKFVSAIILRWISYHHLSAFHGFLHEPTDYPSLVYDLIEPYRSYFDKAMFDHIKTHGIDKDLPAVSIEVTKELLNSKVYTESTRQIVTVHELLHGITLSLRSYLLGETKRFVIPLAGKPNGGRPRKVTFTLYGRSAGKTPFIKEAHSVAAASVLS
jgi:CRISPR/Cas system-associated endonuclease Cas1